MANMQKLSVIRRRRQLSPDAIGGDCCTDNIHPTVYSMTGIDCRAMLRGDEADRDAGDQAVHGRTSGRIGITLLSERQLYCARDARLRLYFRRNRG